MYLCSSVWFSHNCNPQSLFVLGYQQIFSDLLLSRLSLSSLSHHLTLTQILITFTHTTVVLKQWKTNISHGDKTWLKSIIPSLPLPFCLCDYLSRSVSTSTFQFLHCQSLHLPLFLNLNASNSTADLYRSVLFIVKSRWMFHVSKGQARMHTHKLFWTNGIASLQKELCLSAVAKGIRLDLNGYEVFQRPRGSRGEQPLMILSWFPRRAFW